MLFTQVCLQSEVTKSLPLITFTKTLLANNWRMFYSCMKKVLRFLQND